MIYEYFFDYDEMSLNLSFWIIQDNLFARLAFLCCQGQRYILLQIAGPTVTEVPVLIIDVFEVWEGEFLLEKSGEFFLNGLGPMTYKDDELVDVPGYSTA